MKFILCAPPYCKCPTLVKMGNDEWFLHDDYGNRVILNTENLVYLKSAIEDVLTNTDTVNEENNNNNGE